MTTYTLRYARVVILERMIEVPDDVEGNQDLEEVAMHIAMKLEWDQELGLEDFKAKEGSEVVDIQDYDAIWELTGDEEDEEDEEEN